MAWTTPMTAVAGAFSASAWNTHVRDNLLETLPAKATTVGSYFTANATNSIGQRSCESDRASTGPASFNSSSFIAFSPGVSVTVDVPATGAVMFFFAARANCNIGNAPIFFGVGGGGITVLEEDCVLIDGISASNNNRMAGSSVHTGLTPGSTVFSMHGRAGGGTWTISNMELIALPL